MVPALDKRNRPDNRFKVVLSSSLTQGRAIKEKTIAKTEIELITRNEDCLTISMIYPTFILQSLLIYQTDHKKKVFQLLFGLYKPNSDKVLALKSFQANIVFDRSTLSDLVDF